MMIEFFNQTSKNFAGCKEDTDCIDGFACQEPGFCGKKTYSIKEHILFGLKTWFPMFIIQFNQWFNSAVWSIEFKLR